MKFTLNILFLLLLVSACQGVPVAELHPTPTESSVPKINTTPLLEAPLPSSLAVEATATPKPVPVTPQPTVSPLSTVASGSLLAEYLLLYKEGGRLRSLPPRPVFERPEINHIYNASGESFGMFLQIAGPVVSPDGRTVVFNAPQQGPPPPESPTWLVELETGQVEKLEVAGREAARVGPVTWSPDSCCLTFVVENTLYVAHVEAGGAPVPIFSYPGMVRWFARWSPTGKWITVAIDTNPADTASSEREYSYWLISPDGTEEVNLGNFSIGGYGVVPYNMDWSPDGSLLLTPSHQILTPEGELIADGASDDYLTDPTSWIPPAREFHWSRDVAVMTEKDRIVAYLAEDGCQDLVGCYGGLRVVDVSDPTTPREIRFSQEGPWFTVVAIANTVYYQGEGGLKIINPKSGSAIVPNLGFGDMAGAKGYLYQAARGLRILDGSDPLEPMVIRTMFASLKLSITHFQRPFLFKT